MHWQTENMEKNGCDLKLRGGNKIVLTAAATGWWSLLPREVAKEGLLPGATGPMESRSYNSGVP